MTDGDLFGTRKRKRTQKPPDVHLGAVHRLLMFYIGWYKERYREPPPNPGRDGGILKRLVNLYGPDTVEARLRLFVTLDDPFVRNSGYSIPVFYSQWQSLAEKMLKPATQGTMTSAKTREAVAAMRQNISE